MKTSFTSRRGLGTTVHGDRAPRSSFRTTLRAPVRLDPPPITIRIQLSHPGVRQSLAARASGFGFAIPGFAARRWFQSS